MEGPFVGTIADRINTQGEHLLEGIEEKRKVKVASTTLDVDDQELRFFQRNRKADSYSRSQ